MNMRTNEITNSFTSFTKDAYYNGEELPELFKLQDEVVKLTFNEDHADLGSLKIWDVERHLEQMNADCGGAATEELQRFEESCKDLCNMIKGIISGNKGESKAFWSLERIRCTHKTLKNVELKSEDVRTELDAVVITKGGVYIVEVKNTGRDVFIDDEGNYYRTGEYLKYDSHIGAKMAIRKNFIQKILESQGYAEIPVRGIIVFTDSRIQVRNRCEGLTTCFLSQLPHIIDEGQAERVMKDEDLEKVYQAIEMERCSEAYPINFDAAQFKQNYAEVMTALEEASAAKETIQIEVHKEEAPKNRRNIWELLGSAFTSTYARRAGTTAAAVAISLISTAITMKNTY